MKLIDLLKEASVMYGGGGSIRVLPPTCIKDIEKIFDGYGEGVSDFDLYEPLKEYRDSTYYGTITDDGFEPDDENDPYYLAYQRLIKQLVPSKTLDPNKETGINYLSRHTLGMDPAPGAPSDAYNMILRIKNKPKEQTFRITLIAPHITEDAEYVGWFDSRGEYVPDVKYFNEDGERIA